MSRPILYHSSPPESLQAAYLEYDNVDFILNVGPGRSLLKDTVRILGDVRVTIDGTTRTVGGQYWDRKCGAHSFIQSCQTSFGGGSSQGGQENIDNYARWVAMQSIATENEDDMLNASKQVELKAINDLCVEALALGELTVPAAGADPVYQDSDFAIKPYCMLNRMSGDDLPFEKTGDITLTINLSRNITALMGNQQDSSTAYQLTNLRVIFQSIPTVGNPRTKSTVFQSVHNVKSSVQSSLASVRVQVPAICSAVSISFMKQSDENVPVLSGVECQKLPGIRDLSFLFNSANEFITYQIQDINEMLKRYIESFGDTGMNQVYLDTFRGNNGFGLGLNFRELINLSNQQFTMQVTSDITNNDPVSAFFYFHTVIQV